MTSRVDPLLEPFQLKNLKLHSRLVSTSHATAFAVDGFPKERYLNYHLEKAKGGLALTMMGGASCVAPESPAFVNNIALYSDEVVPHLKRLSDAVHEYDTKVMIQVTHAGRRTSSVAGDWLPIVSSTGQREPQHKAFPKVAEDWDIERIIVAFADAIERCKEGGLDGVELLGVGHLLDQFWSPAINTRDDEWGGDPEKRLRFPIEVLRAARERVGDDFVIGARISIDEQLPGGLEFQEGIDLVNRLTEEGLDFLSLIRGGYDSDARLGGVIPPMGTPQHPHIEFCGRVREQVSIPVMHAGRIRDLDVAREAITSGKMDLVGMVRPFISDPYYVQKLRRGEVDRIRPTVGTGFGIDRIYMGGDMVDVGNPSTGREAELPHFVPAATTPKKAVVVGAGIAGLEAARTLAERGHKVQVFEAEDAPGGQVSLTAKNPRRAEMNELITWRTSELERLGVSIEYGHRANRQSVLAHEPDVVVIATGGAPQIGAVRAEADVLTSPWDVVSGLRKLQGDVLVFDDNGGHQGLDVAEVASDGGARVEYVTPERNPGVLLGATNYPPYLHKFAVNGVRITPTTRLVSAERMDNGRINVILRHEFADVEEQRTVDAVVVEHGTRPNDGLYFDLKADSTNGGAVDQAALVALEPQDTVRNPQGSFQLFRIGDAVSSRGIPSATLDAYRLCFAI